LRRVFLDMLLCAGVDEVELQVRCRANSGARRGKVPPVDIIVAEVLDVGDGGMEATEGVRVRGKGGAFDGQKSGGGGDATEESDAAAGLV